MSLTQSDLQEIRTVVRDEVSRQVEPLVNEIKALRNDIQELYDMVTELQKIILPEKEFSKLSTKEQILHLNAGLVALAKHEGVTLPRS